MSSYLRKCIDIAPTAVVTPGPFVANDYRNLRRHTWWPALRETTSWLRLWADWPSVQRVAAQPPGYGEKAAESLSALDAQIDAAHADGMQIILMPYRYPKWSNETEGRVYGNPEDDLFETWDRVARLSAYLAWRAGTGVKPTYKNHEYRLPTDGFGPTSRWAGYVEWLWDRYADRIAAFEVVNEPNGQLWPQRSQVDTNDFDTRWGTDSTTLVSAPAVADMMVTVDAIARRKPGPLLLAPSTSDSDINTVLRYTTISHANEYAPFFDPFVESLLAALDERGFVADERWVWSFHNYSDVERKQHHTRYLRDVLIAGGWRGRQLDGVPELWCTEGGCRLTGANARFRVLNGNVDLPAARRKEYQAQVLTEALSRHHYAKGAGLGIGMVTQYTTYADPGFDCGLLDSAGDGGGARPALAAWCAVPEFHPAPTQRAAWRPQF